MSTCQKCGNEVSGQFCTKCGSTVNSAAAQPVQQQGGIRCPRCGSNNIRTEQKQVQNISVKMKRGNGCLWWLLLGWIYLIYVMFVWMFKFMYFVFIGWWVSIIKKSKQKADERTVVHLCQSCGNRWESK